jgi:hypothetical protein
MTKGNFLTGFAVVVISLMIVSCGKDHGDPTIKFIPGPGFSGNDTILKVNDTLVVSLELNWNGSDVLEVLDVRESDVTMGSFEIGGENVTFNLQLVKGIDDKEEWSFVVIDVKGNQSKVELTLTKDPNSEFGPIRFYASIRLGAQNNIAKAAFVSFQTGQAMIYNLDQAFVNQSKIDLLYYFNSTNQATLASPGSDLPEDLYPGSRSINNWSVRPASKFLKSKMTIAEFNGLTNDAAILTGWNDTLAVSQAVDLKLNDIWLVKMPSGDKAAILIKQVIGTDTGEIDFSIKIQN